MTTYTCGCTADGDLVAAHCPRHGEPERGATPKYAADYYPLLSELEDLARRVGPAATPGWIRGKLEEIISRHRRWNGHEV